MNRIVWTVFGFGASAAGAALLSAGQPEAAAVFFMAGIGFFVTFFLTRFFGR